MRSTSRYRERFSNSGIRCFALRRTRTGFTVELGGTAQLRPIVLLVLFAKYNGAFFNVQLTMYNVQLAMYNLQCTMYNCGCPGFAGYYQNKKEAVLI